MAPENELKLENILASPPKIGIVGTIYLSDNKGESFQNLKKDLGLSEGTLTYHLNGLVSGSVLDEKDKVYKLNERGYKMAKSVMKVLKDAETLECKWIE